MDAQKRNLLQTSPDIFIVSTPKKQHKMNCNKVVNTGVSVAASNNNTTPSTTNGDCFSWAVFDSKLNAALDNKLENVVKKEDLSPITADIQLLREENIRLQKELEMMKNRLEQVDKTGRRNNIVVSGLASKFVPQALEEFKKLCELKLKVSVNVVEVRRIASGKSFLLTLNSIMEVNAILSSRRLLIGSNIFIDRDYTFDERNKRYLLRQLGKTVKNADKNMKIRYGDYSIFINDKPYTYDGDKIIAANKSDAEMLKNVLAKVGFVCTINVKGHTPVNIPPAASGSN